MCYYVFVRCITMQEKKIGEIIAEAREKAGYSQRQLAKEANISNAELSKIE